MKKQLLFLLTIILSFNCFSQISFEKGYHIDNNNQKTECLIKNLDWKNNPTEFEYRLLENSESKKATIKSTKEFGIDNISKYVRSIVDIDRSSDIINKMSLEKKSTFKQENLFLKVLIEGESNLYEYVDGNLRRYFYSKEGLNIEQLIYKTYKTNAGHIAKNNRFRQQLWINLKCPAFKLSKIENVDYKKNDLVRVFTEYNECHNDNSINFEPKEKRDAFNLTIRPRLNNSSLKIQNSTFSARNTDFDNEIGFGLGLEAEYVLPFNKNKWSIAIEPTYQSYKSNKISDVNDELGGQLIAEVNYTSIEIPISLRYYFFLNNKSKLFINTSVILDNSFSNSSIEVQRSINPSISSLRISPRSNLAFGLGYKLNDRYVFEIRYHTTRELLSGFSAWDTSYKTLAVIFGYSLF